MAGADRVARREQKRPLDDIFKHGLALSQILRERIDGATGW
jgi:hypothetical protein